jgi:hypothetical protein
MPHEAMNDAMLGQSSFTAHSTFAIDLAHTVVGSRQPAGGNQEIETLLDTLRHIGTAFSERHDSSMRLFPLLTAPASLDCQMPPLKTAVKLLRRSQGMSLTLICWQMLISCVQMKGISFSLACPFFLVHEVCRIYA